jgi:hypothetical protein
MAYRSLEEVLYEVPSAKALMGAAFVQYIVYSIFYIVEGIKYTDFHSGGSKAPGGGKPTTGRKAGANADGEDNSGVANPREIELEDQNPKQVAAVAEEVEVEPENEFEHIPFLALLPKYHMKTSTWFVTALAMCSFRSAIPLTIAVAYLAIVFRVVQLIGFFLRKRMVSRIAYVLATLCIVILFFADMVMSPSLAFF